MIELLLPRECAGCRRPGESLCGECKRVWQAVPRRVSVDLDFPVWSLSPYRGPHRQVLLSLKERGRRDVIAEVAAVITASISYLAARGDVEHDVFLVPAPTRARSRRLRGGDPVEQVCKKSGFKTHPCLSIAAHSVDSVGLSAQERRRNIKVEISAIPPSPVLLIDDVITTGVTLAASADILRTAGVLVRGALTYCQA